MQTAYTDAAGRPLPDAIELGTENIDGMRIAPGLYKWATPVLIPTAATLDAQGDAKCGLNLPDSAGSDRRQRGHCHPDRRAPMPRTSFWQMDDATTIGMTTQIKGVILRQTAITVQTDTSLEGWALALTAVHTADEFRFRA